MGRRAADSWEIFPAFYLHQKYLEEVDTNNLSLFSSTDFVLDMRPYEERVLTIEILKLDGNESPILFPQPPESTFAGSFKFAFVILSLSLSWFTCTFSYSHHIPSYCNQACYPYWHFADGLLSPDDVHTRVRGGPRGGSRLLAEPAPDHSCHHEASSTVSTGPSESGRVCVICIMISGHVWPSKKILLFVYSRDLYTAPTCATMSNAKRLPESKSAAPALKPRWQSGSGDRSFAPAVALCFLAEDVFQKYVSPLQSTRHAPFKPTSAY